MENNFEKLMALKPKFKFDKEKYDEQIADLKRQIKELNE